MLDFRNDWFLNEHYSKEELDLLWKWVQEGGNNFTIKNNNGKWSGFHPLDTEMKIDIGSQSTKDDCANWVKRLGFEINQ